MTDIFYGVMFTFGIHAILKQHLQFKSSTCSSFLLFICIHPVSLNHVRCEWEDSRRLDPLYHRSRMASVMTPDRPSYDTFNTYDIDP